MQVDGIYRVFYCNRCLLLRGPGDAVTFSASFLEFLPAFALPLSLSPSPTALSLSVLSLFSFHCLSLVISLSRPPSSRHVTHGETFFALFATWSGIDPVPTWLGGGKHEAQRRRGDRSSFPSHFFPPSLSLSLCASLSLSLFFSRKTILSNQRSDNNRDLGINGTNRWLIDCVVYARMAFTAFMPVIGRASLIMRSGLYM